MRDGTNSNIFGASNAEKKGKTNSPRGQVGQSIVGLGNKVEQNRAGSVEGQVAPGAAGATIAESTTN